MRESVCLVKGVHETIMYPYRYTSQGQSKNGSSGFERVCTYTSVLKQLRAEGSHAPTPLLPRSGPKGRAVASRNSDSGPNVGYLQKEAPVVGV